MSDNKRYFDVSFTINVAGYEKHGLGRLSADDEADAIIQAICGESHNLSESDIRMMCEWGEEEIHDDEFIYSDFTVVELYPTDVIVFGECHTAYLPKPCVAAHIGYGTYYQK